MDSPSILIRRSTRKTNSVWRGRFSFCRFLLFLFMTKSVFALNPERHISQYGHTTWRIRDGIFDGSPIVLAQTADGYLWIGTNLGLVRFDGVRFTPWNPLSGGRLFDSRIFSILASRDGSLWIGTGNGIARLSNRELIHYPQLDGRIESIVEDADGTVWLVRTQASNGGGPLCSIKGEQTQCYGVENGMGWGLLRALQLESCIIQLMPYWWRPSTYGNICFTERDRDRPRWIRVGGYRPVQLQFSTATLRAR